MKEHVCETKNFVCSGDNLMMLSYFSEGQFKDGIEVNYCPFCGLSPTIVELSQKEQWKLQRRLNTYLHECFEGMAEQENEEE
jgi:hypothetical protein